MSWSYSGDPNTSPMDAVRFYLQDTDSEDPIMTNEDILFLLVDNQDPKVAAINGVKTLVTKYAMLADSTIGDVSVKYTQKLGDLANLIVLLEDGISAGILVTVGDSNAVAAYSGPRILFKKGMFDNG